MFMLCAFVHVLIPLCERDKEKAHLSGRLQLRCCLQSAYQGHGEQWGGGGEKRRQGGEEEEEEKEVWDEWQMVSEFRGATSLECNHTKFNRVHKKNIFFLLPPQRPNMSDDTVTKRAAQEGTWMLEEPHVVMFFVFPLLYAIHLYKAWLLSRTYCSSLGRNEHRFFFFGCFCDSLQIILASLLSYTFYSQTASVLWV